MKIIADTHLWYYFGEDNTLFNNAKGFHICPTWVNIVELSRTENVLEKEHKTRSAIQKLFHFKENTIFDSPFIYLARLKKNEEHIEVDAFLDTFLEFTERFANGERIDPKHQQQFLDWVKRKRDSVISLCDWFNDKSTEIRNKIDKKSHRKKDTFVITATFISKIVNTLTYKKVDLYNFDFDQIELFWKSLDKYFKDLELSGMKMHPNDWYDFSQLAYIQPGDLFWTRENRWKRIIKDVGLEHYLFDI